MDFDNNDNCNQRSENCSNFHVNIFQKFLKGKMLKNHVISWSVHVTIFVLIQKGYNI